MSKKEKDWKSKAKNPPAGKESPGAMLIGTGEGKTETAATKEIENIDKIKNKDETEDKKENKSEKINATNKTDTKNHTSIDASISNSTEENIEASKVTFVREKIKVKKDKLKYTDTHTAVSTYIRNDLLAKLDRIARYVEGGKAGVINRALEDHLQLYEEED
ncbi:hypothetical protein [Kroppenstedtia sanguinis]|uniref:DUF3408 domain-containing protein n=1 Tax=Kroppenstedtia sanguinis TaxID=1380684 RepID=A0ABW4CG09_9BACL